MGIIARTGGFFMKNFLLPRDGKTNPLSLFSEFEGFFSPFRADELHSLATDIKEYPSYYLLEVEMPGMSKGSADISMENGYLTVSISKTDTNCSTIPSPYFTTSTCSISLI